MVFGGNPRIALAVALLYALFTGNTVTGQVDERKTPDASAKEPEFAPTVQNITIPIGSTVSLNCTVENLEPYTVAWIHNGSNKVLTLGPIVFTSNPRISLGRERGHSFTLVIKDVRAEDSGAYLCQVSSSPQKSLEFFIDIADDFAITATPQKNVDAASREEPGVTQVLPTAAVIAGHTASLKCNLENFGVREISWVNEDTGKVLSLGQNVITTDSRVSLKHETNESSNLLIKDIRMEDSGTYACHLHSDPKKTLHFIVRVIDAPAVSSTSIELHTEHAQRVAILKCTIRSVPRPRLYWSKEGKTLNFSGENYEVINTNCEDGEIRTSIILRNVGVEGLGIYRCHAENNAGEGSARFRIGRDLINSVVTEPSKRHDPILTLENKEIVGHQAECRQPGSPPKDRDILMETKSVDAAARNMGPVLSTEAKKITAKIGQTVALNCSVHTMGHYQITWRRFETQQLIAIGPLILVPSRRFSVIQDAEGTRTLVIKDVQYEDRGLYTCLNAENPMQKNEILVDVVVT